MFEEPLAPDGCVPQAGRYGYFRIPARVSPARAVARRIMREVKAMRIGGCAGTHGWKHFP